MGCAACDFVVLRRLFNGWIGGCLFDLVAVALSAGFDCWFCVLVGVLVLLLVVMVFLLRVGIVNSVVIVIAIICYVWV